MKRSILRRAASTVAVSALAFTGVAVTAAAPAHAAPQTCQTQIVTQVSYPKQNYGSYNTVRIEVAPVCPDGDGFISAGTTFVQRSLNGGATWTNVHSESAYSASLVYYSGTHIAPQNALFRGVYVGGTAGENTYASSTSAPVGVNVVRTYKFKQKSLRAGVRGTFKIQPKASIKKLKVKFEVKKSGKWRTYKKVRANKKGVVTLVFKASRKGIPYRMILPGKRGFSKSTHVLGKARIRYYRPVVS
jgi:hypothetical protein